MEDVRRRVKFPMEYIIEQADKLRAEMARGEGPDPAKLCVHRAVLSPLTYTTVLLY